MGEQMAKVDTNTTADPQPWTVTDIPIHLIDQGEQLLRHEQHDDEILELGADIARNGLLQPIGVRPRPDGRYQLLFGARRLLAHQSIGRTTIPARILPDDATPIKAIASRENLLRRDLSLEEECDAVHHLHHVEQRSPGAISSLLGRSRAWVLRRLAVPQLPPDLRRPLLDGTIALGVAETIALLDDPSTRALVLNQATTAQATVYQVRAMVDALRQSPDFAEAVQAGAHALRHPETLPTPLFRCAHCGEPRELLDLTTVRICTAPCQTAPPATDGSTTD